MNEPDNDKYIKALSKYDINLNDDEIKTATAQLLEKKLVENNTTEVKKLLFGSIDLTSLNAADTDEHIMRITEKVNQFEEEFPDMGSVASICVYPSLVRIVTGTLEIEEVSIASVAAGFPSSQTFIEVKIAETAMAIMEGAYEIDVVMSVGKFLSGDYETVCDEIEELKDVCKKKQLKVILETGALGSASNIKKASILAMYSGADFIKTSTGKLQPAATPEAAYVMCKAIKEYHELTGNKIGFKAAGGINTVNDALIYYTIVKEILGNDWLNKDLFRIGASQLANVLLSDIYGKEINYF